MNEADQTEYATGREANDEMRKVLIVETLIDDIEAALLLGADQAKLSILKAKATIGVFTAASYDFNYEDYIRDRRQAQILAWAQRTFGHMVEITPEVQAYYFIEEALELYFAVVKHKPLTRLNRLVEGMSEREAGDPEKEIGDVLVSLSSLAELLGASISTAEKAEFARLLTIRKNDSDAQFKKKLERDG